MRRFIPLLSLAFLSGLPGRAAEQLLVEAESFAQPGGWVVDQQSMDQMGSAYLLAHGLGVPVVDATTEVEFPRPGTYRLWVRTRDWVATWKTPDTHPDMKAEGTPGIFQVLVDGKAVPVTFGTEGAAWHWQDGGVVEVVQKTVALALHDLTGFAGRCDALLFTATDGSAPPNDLATLGPLRRKLRHLPDAPLEAGEYDLVVVGGGAAGCCAAISAARLGCKVALIHDRPVPGGNNSSEVRVGLSGLIHQQPYPHLGDLVDEWGPVGHWNLYQAQKAPDLPRSKEVLSIIAQHPEKKIHNAGPASNYEDEHKLALMRAEQNLTLCLSTRANGVEMAGKRIAAVIGEDIRTGVKRRFQARLVADCTGDGVIGALAGADFAYGRESRAEFGEDTAPEMKDELVMGTSVQWYADADEKPSPFPECPWALPLNEKTCVKTSRGDWDWETGATRNHVTEIEQIRDYGLRVVYGNWAVLKNHPKFKDEFARQRLKWVAYIGGKRESRRLLGDVILRQQDIVEARPFPDASVTTTWTIDLHYPKETICACEAFRSEARHIKIEPYPIPYRCLYSRNIENLLMAGRNISVTHVALGTVRVQRTTGMMGEVLGMAASLCQQHNATPRGVYERHLAELKALMQRGVGQPDFAAMIQPVPLTARFSDPDYYIWCGTLVKGDDARYHLFYSRWPRRLGFPAWVTHSEIAHAVGPTPLGPFQHRDVALPPRGREFWDGLCTHNPTVHKFGGKYCLYYMGNTGDGVPMKRLNWTHRNNQRIGVAVADSPNGPWTRLDRPIVAVSSDPDAPDALMTSNPAICERPGGGYLIVYKAVGKQGQPPFGGPVVHLAAFADSPTGAITKQLRPIFTAPGAAFPAEDPFIWFDQSARRYHAIVKDQNGYFTAQPGQSLILWESPDGFDWKLAAHPLVAIPEIRWADGRKQAVVRLERPQLFFENGRPAVLLCAVAEDAKLAHSYNIQIPLLVGNSIIMGDQ